jgi:hypothetical protein
VRTSLVAIKAVGLIVLLAAAQPGKAESLGPISEETPLAICDPGQFVDSVLCTGDYCDNLTITCARPPAGLLTGRATWLPYISAAAPQPTPEDRARRQLFHIYI